MNKLVTNFLFIPAEFQYLYTIKKRGQRYTNCTGIMIIELQDREVFHIGDRVIFDPEKIEIFKAETEHGDKPVQQYRQMVLGGIDQVGVVKEHGPGHMTTVSYPDGWVLPIATQYLLPAGEAETDS